MPTFAILIWPVISAFMFAMMNVRVAIAVCIVAGYLLLPPSFGIRLPAFPDLTKMTMPALCALALAILISLRRTEPGQRPGWVPKGMAFVLFAVMLVSPNFTALTNGDPLFRGGDTYQPAMDVIDGLSRTLTLFTFAIPLLLGRKYFATPETHRTLLVVFVVSALIYSIPTLWEVRMSPQLNSQVYGYFPHSFIQHKRWGGFRPVVFLSHALWLGTFLLLAFLAALGCMRRGKHVNNTMWIWIAVWLLVTLVLAKTVGALMLALLFGALIMFLKPRTLVIVAATASTLVLTYPFIRAADFSPFSIVATAVEKYSPTRAESLEFRLSNEGALLERLVERPYFGWGSYGRGRVFNENGDDISITDGYWIITLSNDGWVGFISQFGLLTLPVLLLAYRSFKVRLEPETAVISVLLAVNMLDLIPNASITPQTWLLAGAVWGRLEYKKAERASSDTRQVKPSAPGFRRTPEELGIGFSRRHEPGKFHT